MLAEASLVTDASSNPSPAGVTEARRLLDRAELALTDVGEHELDDRVAATSAKILFAEGQAEEALRRLEGAANPAA